MRNEEITVAVGMSGGVDSSVAAALLRDQGFRVVGLTMAIWDESVSLPEEVSRHACWGPGEAEEIETARRVAAQIGIPFEVMDLRAAYRAEVIEHVRREYLAGRTPNPCVRCNQRLKFGFLLEQARRSGIAFDRFATGHYARIIERSGRFFLAKALARAKDQSYFLAFLPAERLRELMFPLGDKKKSEVRKIAAKLGLAVADRPESQDFIGTGDYGVLFSPDEALPGDIVDESGAVLGRHRGIVHYTVGQRRGVGVATGRPCYVLAIDAARNRIIVGPKRRLLGRGFVGREVNWLVPPSSVGFLAAVRIRNTHREAPALVTVSEDRIVVRFNEPQLAITPGQAAVLYDENETVLGGAIIEKVIPHREES